jgi:hypothetical protein
MAAKAAFSLVSFEVLVSEDWMVGTTVLSETNDFNGCDSFGMIQNPVKTTENPRQCRTLGGVK